jgi:predicted alpha/beta-hydrolase family hydrolase
MSKVHRNNASSDVNLKTTRLINSVDNAKAQVIFAHGAGADMYHEFMEKITLGLNKASINVLRFNFPFMDKRIALGKRYPPDRMPNLLDCYQSVIDNYLDNQTCESNTGKVLPLFIGGKSMGSRVAATLAGSDQENNISGVFCLGYPFHPAKKPEKLRLVPLQETLKPILIVQGERDSLGSKLEIADYELSELCQCLFLADGDHSLKPRVKSGFSHQQHIDSAIQSISNFITATILTNNLLGKDE